MQCSSSGSFTPIQASCVPKPCGNLTDLSPFSGSFIGESCSGVVSGQVCTAFCEEGYTIQGNATVLMCGQGPDSSNGYMELVPGTQDGPASPHVVAAVRTLGLRRIRPAPPARSTHAHRGCQTTRC